jgi:hypothetical protein
MPQAFDSSWIEQARTSGSFAEFERPCGICDSFWVVAAFENVFLGQNRIAGPATAFANACLRGQHAHAGGGEAFQAWIANGQRWQRRPLVPASRSTGQTALHPSNQTGIQARIAGKIEREKDFIRDALERKCAPAASAGSAVLDGSWQDMPAIFSGPSPVSAVCRQSANAHDVSRALQLLRRSCFP